MPWHIDKPALPRGRAYALRTSQLEAALPAAAGGLAVELQYWTPREDGPVLDAELWLPNDRVPHDRLFVRVGSVAREAASAARATIEADVLPELTRWVARVVALPERSPARHARPSFHATFDGARVRVECSPPR